MGEEYVYWAVRKGNPDWDEQILATRDKPMTDDELARMKEWMEKEGFHRLRMCAIDPSEAPDFAKTVRGV